MKFKRETYEHVDFKGDSPYFERMIFRPDLSKAITFGLAAKRPIHNWFYYKQGFSPELIYAMVKETSIGKNGTVFDPFCGVGTTLLASKEMGSNSIGIDILPLAVFVSSVKLRDDHDPKKNRCFG